LLTAIEEYQRWCPELARYSFHTRAMTANPAVGRGLREAQ